MRHRSPVGALTSHGCGRAGAHDRVTGLESNGLDSETKTATRYLRGPESRTAVRRLQRRADRQTRGRAMPLGARLNASALVAARCRALPAPGQMLAAERKQGPGAVLLDPAARSSLLCGIRGGREFCVFVIAEAQASARRGRAGRLLKRSAMTIVFPEPPLATATLLLRPWEPQHVSVLLDAGRDPLIWRYRYSLPRTRDEAQKWIALTETDRTGDRRLELAVDVGGTLLGSVSLTDWGHGNAMVRFWLLPAGRGQGLATTAVRLTARWAFSLQMVGRLAAFVETDNTASKAVLQRCGFVHEGLLRQHMTGRDGKRVDTLLYGLLPADLRE
jgi:RimJ/RimL family protein N-acetyltransferase